MTDPREPTAGSPYIVGPPIVDPDCFFGREAQIRMFFEKQKKSQPMPMRVLGIRRSGKTSFLRHISRPQVVRQEFPLSEPATILAYVDMQSGITDPQTFFSAVARAVNEAIPGEMTPGKPTTFLDFQDFVAWISRFHDRYRLLILLDEFEIVAQREAFKMDFFWKIRSQVSERLVWITASSRDIFDFTRPLRSDNKPSPLLNVFYPVPIYLGSLEPEESERLIREPAERVGIPYSNEEVQGIRLLSGDLPYLVQATADQWIHARADGVRNENLFDHVRDRLLAPGSLIRHQFSEYWRLSTFHERKWLKKLAVESIGTEPDTRDDTFVTLRNYGLIARRNGRWVPASNAYQHWINHYSDMASGVPHVFIGHGHSRLWETVNRHLKEEYGLEPVYYEKSPRAGESIVPILKDMIGRSEFAVIVVTAEDETPGNTIRPRQNVVHEAGLFQGALGFSRTVLLVQEGVEMFSNLDGFQHIPFKERDIDSTFFNLSKVLRREQVID